MGHLGLPSEVMSFQGNSQILSASAKLELLRNEVTWKETGSGVQKTKARLHSRLCKRRGWSRLQAPSLYSQHKALWAPGLTWGVALATVGPAAMPPQPPVVTGSWGLAWKCRGERQG